MSAGFLLASRRFATDWGGGRSAIGGSAAAHQEGRGLTVHSDQVSARIKNTIGMIVRRDYSAARFAGFSHASTSRNVL
jgi:hypothetical protein